MRARNYAGALSERQQPPRTGRATPARRPRDLMKRLCLPPAGMAFPVANVARAGALLVLSLALVACGRGQHQGGFSGFPPAPVTLAEVKTVTVPLRFEYVGQTAGSKEAEVRARVQGI